jgi:hypothetical protein
MRDCGKVFRSLFGAPGDANLAPFVFWSHHQNIEGNWVRIENQIREIGLQLPFPEVRRDGAMFFRLQELVRNFVREEADSYQWPVGEVPNLLLIELMRFSNIGERTFKRSEEVREVPLSLSVYADRPNDVHVLRAFITHHGDSLEAGHHTAGVFRKGRWWHCNGAHVVACETPNADNLRDAYILFYVRADGLEFVWDEY